MAVSTPCLIDMHPEAVQVPATDFGSDKIDHFVDVTKMTERCLVSAEKGPHHSSFVASQWPEETEI
jgi:hypothetical protein